MGTWRASSEADTRQDSRVKSAKMADALTVFILKEQEIVRKGVIEKDCVLPCGENAAIVI